MTSETDMKMVAAIEGAAVALNRALAEAASHSIQTDVELVEVTSVQSPVVETKVIIHRVAKVLGLSKG